jgi:hypothetical protein
MSNIAAFPSFSSLDNPQLRFPQYLNSLIDHAANRCTYRVDGLAGYLLPPATFLAKFGHAYVFPAAREVEPPSIPAANWTTWKHHDDTYVKTANDLQDFRNQFLAGLDLPTLLLFEEVGGGNRNRTLEWMVSRMQIQYGTISAAQFESYDELLAKPYIIGDSMQALIAQHNVVHLAYASNAQPLPEVLKVRYLLNCLRPSGRFTSFMDGYYQRYPTVAQQTFLNASTDLSAFERNMDQRATSQSMGLAASTVTINALVATAVKEALLAAGVQPITKAATPQPKFYCWTHGQNATHNSDACRQRAEGHISTATNHARQGGSNTVWSKSKRRQQDT